MNKKQKNQDESRTDDLEQKIQSVIITLSDGTKAVFTGKAICSKGETRTIIDIKFTEPRDLPDNCSWGTI